MRWAACTALAFAASAAGRGVVLADFGGGATTHEWAELDDPTMGGKSHGTWNVTGGVGVFAGETVDVPSLGAPGFCEVDTCTPKGQGGGLQRPCGYVPGGDPWGTVQFPDASAFTALRLRVRSLVDYAGFQVCFQAVNATLPADVPKFPEGFSPKCFKTNFTVPELNAWVDVTIPFDHFSVDWSPFTGLCSSKDPEGDRTHGYQHKCCSEANPEVCPTKKHLASISGLYLWAEGTEGKFHLEVESISAVDA